MTIALALLLLAAAATAWRVRGSRGRRPFRDTPAQARRLYSRRGFLRLGAGVAASALLVYSGADEAVDRWHDREVRSPETEKASSWLRHFGERFWFLFWGAFAALDGVVGSSALTRWGRRSFEAMVVGLPMLWTTQRVLGAARPSDRTHGPDFLPFADDNSASGHAFIAAIPLMVAGRTLPRAPLRGAALAMAPAAGWSRIHDRKHYLGQVLLGLWIAWNAVDAALVGASPPPAPETDPAEDSA